MIKNNESIFNDECPSFEEILSVSKPGTSENERRLMTCRLEKFSYESELLEGVWLFLSDNNFDYDLLYEFLREDKFYQTKTPIRPRLLNSNYYKFAAVAAVFIFVLITFTFYNNYVKSREILKYSITDIGLPVYASIEAENINILSNEMMSYYKAGKFSEAINCIEKIELCRFQNDTLNYYAGLAYFHLKNFKMSSERMSRVSNDTTCIFSERAKYVNGLSQIMLDHKDTGKALFRELVNAKDNQVNELSKAILKNENIW